MQIGGGVTCFLIEHEIEVRLGHFLVFLVVGATGYLADRADSGGPQKRVQLCVVAQRREETEDVDRGRDLFARLKQE